MPMYLLRFSMQIMSFYPKLCDSDSFFTVTSFHNKLYIVYERIFVIQICTLTQFVETETIILFCVSHFDEKCCFPNLNTSA